jgi:hypothetical protein
MADVDVNKSFFLQGGTSLKALQLVALVKEEICDQINIQFFFDHLSILDLVDGITKSFFLVQ